MKIQSLLQSKNLRLLALALGCLSILTVAGFGLAWVKTTSASSPLEASFDQESWRRGYCPACGGLPDFTFIKEDGTRWLRCSECDAEWLFQRIECPYCGNQDQVSLGYILADNEGFCGCRVYLCEECGSYIGGIDTREVSSADLRTVERIKVSAMEKEAESMGFKPGWKNELVYDREIVSNSP